MRHEVITTAEEWTSLRSEWNELLFESGAKSLFMTWQWLDTWVQLHDIAPRLFVICVRDQNGKLSGVAPYYVVKYSLLGVLPFRILRMIGDTNSGAEYQTWIARSTNQGQVFDEIVAGLRTHMTDWDLLWMPKLNAWSGLSTAVIDAMRKGRLLVNSRPNMFSAFLLPGNFDLYLKQMSSNRRQQIRRMSRKILSEPHVEIKKVSSRDELAPALAAFFDLHGKRWRAAGENGVFVDKPREKAFYEQFVPIAFDQGWLAMYTLLDNDVPKAVQLGYVYDGVFLQLQEGFDPDYSAHVGNVLRAFVIEDCINCGVREYDFLGGVSEHKSRWLGEERIGMDLLAARPGLKTLPIMHAGIWPTGAYLQPQDGVQR